MARTPAETWDGTQLLEGFQAATAWLETGPGPQRQRLEESEQV